MREFEVIENEIKADIAAIEAKFEPAVETIEADAKTLEQQIIAMGYPLIIQDALALLTGAFTAGTNPAAWATFVATLIKTAENQGHAIVAAAADSALNLAKAQLVISGTVAPTTPAAPTVEAPPVA